MADQHLKARLRQLPDKAGCYLFKDARGKVIYVGKAKSLRSRVRNYFQKAGPGDPKTAALVDKVADLDLLVTGEKASAGKIAKAEKAGVQVLSEADYLSLIG